MAQIFPINGSDPRLSQQGDGGANGACETTGPLVIQIGFNRCATLTFHCMMEANGIPALHWKEPDGRNIAQVMVSNMAMGRKPLEGFEGIRVFSDMAYLDGKIMIDGARFFRALHAAYPDAYFLFNTRDKAEWMSSRMRHANGTYLARCAKVAGVDVTNVPALWAQMYDQHTAEVESYFATAEARFLHFYLDCDSPQKIADWLAPDFELNMAHWGHHNRKTRARAHLG